MLLIVLGMFIRSLGKPSYHMFIMILVNIINIFLDWLFIVVYKVGLSGAAWASTISLLVGLVVAIFYLQNNCGAFKFSKFSFSKKDAIDMLKNESSELIGQWAMMLTSFLFNLVVIYKIGIIGIVASTIAGYSGYLFTMITIGIGQGIAPLISFSYGADKMAICQKIRRHSLIIISCFGIFFTILMWLLGSVYAKWFSNDPALVATVGEGVKIYAIGFIFAGYNIIASFSYTAMGMAKQSAIISALRGLIIISILILTLPLLFGMSGIWYIFPITEIITAFISRQLIKRESIKNLQAV